jgi:hypothetical protein
MDNLILILIVLGVMMVTNILIYNALADQINEAIRILRQIQQDK